MALTSARMAKIVCTLGPASDSEETIRKLIQSNMDVVRLNFSHGTYEGHQRNVATIRRIAAEEHRHIAILQDLQGPKIRMGKLPEEGVELAKRQQVALAPSKNKLPLAEALPVDYDHLCDDVKVGDVILLSDGKIELHVKKISADRVFTQVIHEGQLFSRKGVNMPSSDLRISSFTDKDRQDLEFGLQLGVDFVAMSFLRHEDDLEPVIQLINTSPSPPRLIAKIEKPQAVERIDQILAKVDAIMVARGDLGVEMPAETLPRIQKDIIKKALLSAKDVITATQMLLSMVQNPSPTRAEVSDVANAIFDGSSAVMLSDETAAGSYPLEACQVMNRISTSAAYTCPDMLNRLTAAELDNGTIAIGRATCLLAADLKAEAILTFTLSGNITRAVSRFRPSCPVIALTPSPNVARHLNLVWGVIPGVIEMVDTIEKLQAHALVWLRRRRLYQPGRRIIVTAGAPLGQSDKTNLIEVVEL